MKPRALALAGLAALGVRAGDGPGFALQATTDLACRRDLMATWPRDSPATGRPPDQFQAVLSLVANQGPWTGGLTVRDVNFYQQNPNLTLERPTASLYRKYIKYSANQWSLQAGDFNTLIGRGLLLSVVENAAILQEKTILGGDARGRFGPVEVHALAGTVTTDDRTQQWRITGGEASVEVFRGNRVGILGSTIEDGRVPLRKPHVGRRQCRSASASGKDLFGTLDYYAELGRMDFLDQPAPFFQMPVDPRHGDGAYGNLSFHPRAWFLMAEYKNYKNFDNALSAPPLADRDTERNDLFRSTGRRIYGQYSFKDPDLTLFLSAGRYRELFDAGHNVYGGFKVQDAFDRLDLSCTYGQRTVQYQEKRTDAALTWRFTPLWSLGLTLRDQRNRPPWSAPYEETDFTVQVARSPRYAVYVLQQRSTVPVFDATRLFYGGLRVNFRRGSYLDCSGGRLRGGEVCAGGQCITLPPFRGWKLAAHLRW